MTAMQTLKAKAATQTTDTLLGALLILDKHATRNEYERMSYAAIADVIEARHGLDSEMDAIFTESFHGTYAEAILIALAVVTA